MAATKSKTLGERIREARVAHGFKLRPFAKKLEISPTHLSDVEHDRRVPSEELLGEIARELDLDFDTLMNLAGRLGEKAEQYAQAEPAAAALFRKLSDKKAGKTILKQLDSQLDELMAKNKRKS
jgi:transcriptional regulator with XRE-family HTH domain